MAVVPVMNSNKSGNVIVLEYGEQGDALQEDKPPVSLVSGLVVFPNPFNPQTEISFSLPACSEVTPRFAKKNREFYCSLPPVWHHPKKTWSLFRRNQMFEITQEESGTLVLNGRLDAAAAPKARRFFDDIETTCRLDFSGLEYIASVGLGLLASAQKRLMATGDGLVLAGLNPHLREVFSLAGFEGIFEFE